MNAGVRRPERNVRICLALLAASLIALVAGILAMRSAGAETTASATAIALGLLGTVIFSLMLANFVWATRLVAGIKRGENVIARWTVPADAFDRFRAQEAGHAAAGHPNDYKPPNHTPPEGVEVVFGKDSMIIGDTFYGLATTGLGHIRQVGIVPGDPLCIGFQTALTTGRIQSSGVARFDTALGLLRIPVAKESQQEAKAVLDHYTAALSGQVMVKPDFWKRRIRWGLRAALVSAFAAGTGFLLEAIEADLGILPLILAVSGVIIAIGGLILAGLAWTFADRQRRGHVEQ
jgi:hypothetical protein